MTSHLETLLIGTYGKWQSRELFSCSFDRETGQFSNLQPLADAPQSAYLTQTETGLILSIYRQGEQGGLALFDQTGQLLTSWLEDAPPPCHISYDRERQLIYTANYHTGAVCAYQLTNHGQLTLIDRQELGQGSHPHYIGLTPDQHLVVCDLGHDRLITYCLTQNKLQQINQFDLPKGTGPRHLTFHPQRKTVYVVGESSNTIETLFYDGYGAFEHYQSHPTLPEQAISSATATLGLTPDEHFLYVSNRGHDSLAGFAILADGCLCPLPDWTATGHTPRDLTLNQTGQWLLVACQDSNQVMSFAIDPKNGQLTPGSTIQVPEPVALLVHYP